MTVTELRQKYPIFVYQTATWQIEDDQFIASFAFSAKEHTFHHQIAFACDQKQIEKCTRSMISQLVFSLGLVEMLSYWKAFCSPMIQVEASSLTAEQIEWWHKLLINGMGEYFYVNQIDFTDKDFVKIVAADQNSHSSNIANLPSDHSAPDHVDTRQPKTIDSNQPSTFLVPIGGGKDSIVTLELLKQFSPLTLLLVNPTQAARDIASQSDLTTITVSRQIDPYLLTLNNQVYLNGHVPFSASLAFISVLVAYLHQIDNVALSNEASANEASLTYLDRPINHQYSKSFEFEKDFRDYLNDLPNTTNNTQLSAQEMLKRVQHDEALPTYFSLLRPLNELQIGRLFAKLGQPYFSIFRSCNKGSKTNIWCGDCPKCLFAYLMLAPWLSESTMVSIFGQNLLEKEKLLPTLNALIGTTDHKPLECVGLREESLVACHLLIKRYQESNTQLPALLSLIKPELDVQVYLPTRSSHLLNDWNLDHHLPTSLDQFLHDFLQKSV